jgi:hypothetical protein
MITIAVDQTLVTSACVFRSTFKSGGRGVIARAYAERWGPYMLKDEHGGAIVEIVTAFRDEL